MGLWISIGFWGLCGGIMLAVFIAAVRAGRPLRRLLGCGIQGVCAVAAVNVAGAFTGVSLGLNMLTLGSAFILGIPGIIGLLLLKLVTG